MLGGELELGGRDLPRAQDLTPFRDLGTPSHAQYASLECKLQDFFVIPFSPDASLDQADGFH